jgi:acyl-CoA synthetase (AMP-forming)/AMP-acid ligase II
MTDAMQDIEIQYPEGNVFALFGAAAEINAARPFLIVGGETLLTYGDMLAESGRAAAWLRSQGVKTGDRAIIQALKSTSRACVRALCSSRSTPPIRQASSPISFRMPSRRCWSQVLAYRVKMLLSKARVHC